MSSNHQNNSPLPPEEGAGAREGAHDVAIRVSNLSKCYHIYDRPQDRLKQSLVPRFQRFIGKPPTQYAREFWALKDVSFEVKKGETVGIIGRNGSGKSTLLQMICGTLTPTSGTIAINGRVAALLELGAGFNTEFTGRENVYMNASVLGLSKDDIDERFDDIVTFADIGEFIDQPIKTYSSGMYVRLAFAIAVHVEPDILVVDEALSVGDIAFRNKCILKIKELRERGVTLLFVSHDLSTLQMICERAIWLNAGQVSDIGDPVRVSSEYYIFMTGSTIDKKKCTDNVIQQQTTGMARFTQCKLFSPASDEPVTYGVGEKIGFDFALEAIQNLGEIIFAVSIYRNDGDWLIGQTSREDGVFWAPAKAGDMIHGALIFESIILAPGDYMAAFGAYSRDHSICYALTDLTIHFSIRSLYPTWGKFIHPCEWIVGGEQCLPL